MGRIELHRQMLPAKRFRWSPRSLLVLHRLLQRGNAERSAPEIADPDMRSRQCSPSIHA